MKVYYLSTGFTRKRVLTLGLFLLFIVGGLGLWSGTKHLAPLSRSSLVILAYNELGMHCIQPDYSSFLILPPANYLRVQVFQKGEEPHLMMQGITVKYRLNQMYRPSQYTNFWVYADKYGYRVPADVGITGNTLEGQMQPDPTNRFWQATAIPVVTKVGSTTKIGSTTTTGSPEGSSPVPGPYQTVTISVYDSTTQKLLGEQPNVVLPVSDEMNCAKCHGTQYTWTNILKTHDRLEGTELYPQSQAGQIYACNKCHADPVLEAPGLKEVPSLSLAMHGFHQDKQASCLDCHPGIITNCNRGVMAGKGFKCVDCHGNLTAMAQGLRQGRIPWQQEPTCKQCHNPIYGENPGTLYRNSYLTQSPHEDMNNIILCASCHNSPHAEWPSTLQLDNELPISYQGTADPIGTQCNVCHVSTQGKVH